MSLLQEIAPPIPFWKMVELVVWASSVVQISIYWVRGCSFSACWDEPGLNRISHRDHNTMHRLVRFVSEFILTCSVLKHTVFSQDQGGSGSQTQVLQLLSTHPGHDGHLIRELIGLDADSAVDLKVYCHRAHHLGFLIIKKNLLYFCPLCFTINDFRWFGRERSPTPVAEASTSAGLNILDKHRG